MPWEKQERESPSSQAGARGTPGKAGWNAGGWGGGHRVREVKAHLLPALQPPGSSSPGCQASAHWESNRELQAQASEPREGPSCLRGRDGGGRCDSVEHLCCMLLVLERTGCLHRVSPVPVSRIRGKGHPLGSHAQLPRAPKLGLFSSSPLPTFWWEEHLWGPRRLS